MTITTDPEVPLGMLPRRPFALLPIDGARGGFRPTPRTPLSYFTTALSHEGVIELGGSVCNDQSFSLQAT